jgi:hypothetical protein
VDTDISISLDEYNTLNVNLFNLGETMDPSCCFFNIIDIYKNILYAIKTAFDNKNTIKSTLNSAESWRQDSIILHNNQLLQDYINNLNNQMKLFSVSTTATAATIKPKYAKYIELYGIPPDLIFDPSLLSQIQTEYCL